MVVVVVLGRVVVDVLVDVDVELVEGLVVDGLVEVVGAAGLVVVVVAGAVAPSPAAHAVRHTAPAVTAASTSDPRPMPRHRHVPCRT